MHSTVVHILFAALVATQATGFQVPGNAALAVAASDSTAKPAPEDLKRQVNEALVLGPAAVPEYRAAFQALEKPNQNLTSQIITASSQLTDLSWKLAYVMKVASFTDAVVEKLSAIFPEVHAKANESSKHFTDYIHDLIKTNGTVNELKYKEDKAMQQALAIGSAYRTLVFKFEQMKFWASEQPLLYTSEDFQDALSHCHRDMMSAKAALHEAWGRFDEYHDKFEAAEDDKEDLVDKMPEENRTYWAAKQADEVVMGLLRVYLPLNNFTQRANTTMTDQVNDIIDHIGELSLEWAESGKSGARRAYGGFLSLVLAALALSWA